MTKQTETNEQTTSWKTKIVGIIKSSWFWAVALFIGLIVVDQVTKIWADWYFNQPSAPKQITIIPGWINLCITYNRGISYVPPVVKAVCHFIYGSDDGRAGGVLFQD